MVIITSISRLKSLCKDKRCLSHCTYTQAQVECCFSKLTDKQKALMTAYAELETDTNGTVRGVTQTTEGKRGIAH